MYSQPAVGSWTKILLHASRIKSPTKNCRETFSTLQVMYSRLAVGHKAPVGVEPTSTGLQPAAWPSGSSVKYPRQESNLIPDLRRVVCDPPHPEDDNIPARIRTGIQTLEESDVAPLHHQDKQEPTAGFAPA